MLNRHFAGRVVRKDLTKLVKEGANVPVYVLEFLNSKIEEYLSLDSAALLAKL